MCVPGKRLLNVVSKNLNTKSYENEMRRERTKIPNYVQFDSVGSADSFDTDL